MTPDVDIILSIPQLRLSLNLLGFSSWNDLPLMETEEPAEQRIMNAFLALIQREKLVAAEGGYRFDAAFEDIIRPIGQAEQVCQIVGQDLVRGFLYHAGQRLAAITPDAGRPDHCRVFLWENCSREAALASLTESGCIPALHQIREVPAAEYDSRISDPEKLRPFFQSVAEREISE